ncbi:MAG: ABC transporter permease [Acidobacteria bacterium]|nr:ABC transporter permease [Acidobacteriota bacterium]
MNWLSQIGAVTELNIRTIPERLASSIVAIIGVAGVVTVFVAVLSIAEGFRRTMNTVGPDDTALVMRGGADSEMSSIMPGPDALVIKSAPGIRRGRAGPLASAELFVVVDRPKRTSGTEANVPLRGVQPEAFDIRSEVEIVEGRRFQTGRNEIIAGRAAAAQFDGLDVGTVLRWGENSWTVVGIFRAGGSVAESEVWCDVGVLQPAYRRGNSFNSMLVRLESREAFDRFKDALTTDPRLNVRVLREADYYAEQSRLISRIIRTLGTAVAVLMGIGAVFGALNTMYSAVAARTREIATLRALGFGATPVVVSVLLESLLLALIGGVAGGGIAYVVFNGFQTATINWQTFSQVAFAFAVTPALLARGILYALVMGLIGGLFPAIRAARLPVVVALREL